jgi:ABC-2 type transport system ATP-binding protein
MIIHRGKIVANGTPDMLRTTFAGKVVVNLEVNQSPDVVRQPLSEIAGVQEVKAAAGNGHSLCELVCEKGTDPREAIFHKVVENQWVLLGMERQVSRLEDVFRQLTTGGGDE